MQFDEFLKSFPSIELTRMQIACCRYLERQGLRFLVDFGYDNAEKLAWAHLEGN